MSLSLSPGMGSLADSTLLTDADGRAATTYEALAPGTDTVEAVCGESSASFSFEVAATPEPAGPGETFAYSHTEASLVLELLPLGDPGGLAPGAHAEMRLSARYETWDVHLDAAGGTRLENHTSAPAEGAAVTWWLESGDGHVSGHASADAAGEATATLAMGHSDCLVRAEVSFAAAANSASASFLFTAAPANYDDPAYYDPGYYEDPSSYTDPNYTDPGTTDPGYTDPGYTDPGYTDPGYTDPGTTDPGATSTYSHSETVLVLVNLAVSSPTPQVGESVTLSGEVRAEVRDVWTDSGGGEQRVYNYSQAAPGVLVELAEESGGGQLGAASATTDGAGWFSVSYTVGSDGAVSLSAAVAGSDPAGPGRASVQFWPQPADPGGPTPGTPSFLHHEGAWRLGGPQADGPTYGLAPGAGRILSGTLSYESWEVWDDGQGGTLFENAVFSPAPGEALEARLAYGDGQIGATDPGEGPVHLSTGPEGGFSLVFAMGTQASRVEILRQGEVLGHLDLVPPAAQPGPVWSWVRDESSLFVQLSASVPGGDPAAPLDPGAVLEVGAEVLEASWEVWANEAGAVELRHQVVGPAVNVAVAFSKEEGPGEFAPDQEPAAPTDLEGRTSVLFVLGEAPARLRAEATFLGLGASAERLVSPDLWELSSTEGSLELSLEAEGSPADTLAATVRYRSHQVWTRPATGESEIRHETVGPAAGAEILLSPGGDTAAAFATNSLLAGPDGTARTAYSSAGDGTIAVTARFAGLETHAEFAAPAGYGAVGGGGGGGGGGGDPGAPPPGGDLPGGDPGTPGSGPGSGGIGTPSTPSTPVPPLPQVVLKGRAHWTEGGGGGPGSQGTDPQPFNALIEGNESNIADYYNHLGSPWLIGHGEEYEEVMVSLTAHLERPLYGFDHEILDVQTRTVSGPVPGAQEELDEALAEGWRIVTSTEVEYVLDSRYYWWVELEGLIPGTDPTDATGEEFVVMGRPLPQLEIQPIHPIAGESTIAGLYDDAGSPPNPNVHLAPSSAEEGMEASFDSDAAWTEQDRIAEGHMGRAAPEMLAEASFTTGIVPQVSWSEYWLQAETALPQDAPDIPRTFLLHAKRTNAEGETEQEAIGTVTFAVSEYQEISNAKPDVKGMETFAAWIDARDDGTLRLRPPVERGKRNTLSLLPVEFITSNPDRGGIEISDGTVSLTDATPVVEMEVTDAQLDGNGQLTVTVEGRMKDRLSEAFEDGGSRLQNLNFSVNGESESDTRSFQYAGNGTPPFSFANSETDFTKTFTVPDAQPGTYVFKAETDENAAGNTGWDKVAVTLYIDSEFTSVQNNGPQVSITFNNEPSDTSTDTAQIYYGSSPPASGATTVTESGAATNQFTGTIEIDGETADCTIMLGTIATDDQTQNRMSGTFRWTFPDGTSDEFSTIFLETGNQSLQFTPDPTSIQVGEKKLVIGEAVDLPGSQRRAFEPIGLRIPFGDDFDGEDVTIKVNGEDHKIKNLTYNGESSWYVVKSESDEHAKAFLPSVKPLPSAHSVQGIGNDTEDSKIEWSMQFAGQGSETKISDTFVMAERPEDDLEEGHPADGPSDHWKPGDTITREHLFTAYKFIYPDELSRILLETLLEQEGEGDVTLRLEGVFWGNYSFDRLEIGGGYAIEIENSDSDVHPGIAAAYLHRGLISALTESFSFRNLAVEKAMDEVGTELTVEVLEEWRKGVGPVAAQTGLVAAECYLAGIGIVNEGADWALVINDVSEGHYSSLAAILPFVPRGLVKAGETGLRVKNRAGDVLEDLSDVAKIDAVKELYRTRDLRVMGTLMDDAQMSASLRKAFSSNGGNIPVPGHHGELKERMLGISPFAST